MTPLNILKRARTKISDGWCQSAYARNRLGHSVAERGGSATAFCAVGALWAISSNIDEVDAACLLLNSVIGEHNSLSAWNDALSRTQADVLAAYDKAIAKAEGR